MPFNLFKNFFELNSDGCQIDPGDLIPLCADHVLAWAIAVLNPIQLGLSWDMRTPGPFCTCLFY